MHRIDSMAAEFEASGEVEVRRRIAHGDYDAPHLAHALRWLDDRAVDRTLPHEADPELERERGERTLDAVIKLALGGAGLAAVAGAVVGVMSLR
ncbi:hypothetical protein ACO2Q3_25665 [Caulobacter sp. KR2-114]|uniref:hypothetical protein n=1 Tax=Caulobacter sp. KR2-114 TaxID=3400912 RepID=UPI003C0BAB36